MDEPKDKDDALPLAHKLMLHPHQQSLIDHLKNLPPVTDIEWPSASDVHARYPDRLVIDSCPPSLGADDVQALSRLNRMAQSQRDGKGLPPIIVHPKTRDRVHDMVFLYPRDPDPDEPVTLVKQKARIPMSGKMALMMGTLGAIGIDPVEAFANWDPRGERRLSPEEARAAFKTSDADKARILKAEAKRQRKAAKLAGRK
jgi:hypothetical protein